MQILAIAHAVAAVCAWRPIPNHSASLRGDLFSVALTPNVLFAKIGPWCVVTLRKD